MVDLPAPLGPRKPKTSPWRTCPLIILTLGLFILVVNALMLRLAAWLVPSLTVDGFGPAFLGTTIISIVSILIKDDRGIERPRE